MNKLSNNAYTMNYKFFSQTVNKKELQQILLDTDGWILANGEAYDIKSKHLGAGIYKVYLGIKEL